MTSDPRFEQAIARFDEANSADPNQEMVDGEPQPKELVYARRMSDWLLKLESEPSEPLKLAARAQHLCRWKIPRDSYPMDRTGYLKWRTDLKKMHAELAREVLLSVGYEDETIERVELMLLKKNLKRDDEVQTLEDVICLVFLENYFEKFATEHDEEKLVDILRKTWIKMSERGRKAALTLPLPEHLLPVVTKAVQEAEAKLG